MPFPWGRLLGAPLILPQAGRLLLNRSPASLWDIPSACGCDTLFDIYFSAVPTERIFP